MKKIQLLMIFTVFIILSACGQSGKSVNVIVPNGSPALSQVQLQHDSESIDKLKYNVDVVFGADLLISAFGSESHDIIFAPTNVGANLISKGAPYQFLGAINWGSFYLASAQEIQSFDDLDGKEIIAFGQNATPHIILDRLLESHSFVNQPTLHFVDGADAASAELQNNPKKIILIAEPMLSVLEMKMSTIYTIDLQESWAKHYDTDYYPQASVFVHNDLDNTTIDLFESHLKESIEKANNSPEIIAEYADALEYPFPAPVIISSLPRSNLRYVESMTAKESLVTYFEIIMDFEPNLIGGALPNDSFYYKE